MITKFKPTRWKASDGLEYDTREEAQVHDLLVLLGKQTPSDIPCTENYSQQADVFSFQTAEYLVAHAAAVLDILVTDGRRRRRVKKSGAKAAKKAKPIPACDVRLEQCADQSDSRFAATEAADMKATTEPSEP
jgi:hypothetical protein